MLVMLHATKKACAVFLPLFMAAVGCSGASEVPAPTAPKPPTIAPAPVPDQVVHKGSIEVQSSPAGLQVKVNGKVVGKTPVTIDNLAPGTHEVTYVDPQDGDVTMSVELGEGQYRVVRHNVAPSAVDN